MRNINWIEEEDRDKGEKRSITRRRDSLTNKSFV